jgi:hypothetical protein
LLAIDVQTTRSSNNSSSPHSVTLQKKLQIQIYLLYPLVQRHKTKSKTRKQSKTVGGGGGGLVDDVLS